MHHFTTLIGLVLYLALPWHSLQAAPDAKALETIREFQYDTALKASQDAIGRTPADHLFTDHAGRAVRFSSFRGKPLVLSLVYTSCYHICPMTTRHLHKVVEKAREALGENSFSVAVLGFDSQHDGPQEMGFYAKKQGIEEAGWSLLSADSETINAFTKELGFVYFSSPNGFDHVVQSTVIDAKGEIYRQVYGEVFETPLLVEPLKQLVLGRPKPNQTFFSELADKVRFFCTTYDPSRDGYRFDYSLFVGMIIGALIIILGGVFLVREFYKGKRVRGA
ncbi:MAG: SCO family protein [Gammaproteobacteria bacterium]|nr:SCO family protein [Gammaproteobacteria bacterium]